MIRTTSVRLYCKNCRRVREHDRDNLLPDMFYCGACNRPNWRPKTV